MFTANGHAGPETMQLPLVTENPDEQFEQQPKQDLWGGIPIQRDEPMPPPPTLQELIDRIKPKKNTSPTDDDDDVASQILELPTTAADGDGGGGGGGIYIIVVVMALAIALLLFLLMIWLYTTPFSSY
jgi:hypothetical protein